MEWFISVFFILYLAISRFYHRRLQVNQYKESIKAKYCVYCGINEKSHGRIKNSYDDSDGMTLCIHPSEKKPSGYQSKAWWMTVNFRGHQRDFYIDYCPFCGRRLTPEREEINNGCQG